MRRIIAYALTPVVAVAIGIWTLVDAIKISRREARIQRETEREKAIVREELSRHRELHARGNSWRGVN